MLYGSVKCCRFFKKNNSSHCWAISCFFTRGVKATRIYIDRFMEKLRSMTTHILEVTEDMQRNILWFLNFVHVYNDQSSYQHPVFSDETPIEFDAFLRGLGVLYVQDWDLS